MSDGAVCFVLMYYRLFGVICNCSQAKSKKKLSSDCPLFIIYLRCIRGQLTTGVLHLHYYYLVSKAFKTAFQQRTNNDPRASLFKLRIIRHILKGALLRSLSGSEVNKGVYNTLQERENSKKHNRASSMLLLAAILHFLCIFTYFLPWICAYSH